MQPIPSEKYVKQLFQTCYGITLLKIDERGGKEGPTPDFEFFDREKKVFVCELRISGIQKQLKKMDGK